MPRVANPYKAGERVWVNRGGEFAQGTLTSNARLEGRSTRIDVRYDDGGSDNTAVSNVHRMSSAFAAWLAAQAAAEQSSRALTKVCLREGLTYGGKACQATPEWKLHKRLNDAVSAAGAAAFAVHPYQR